MTKSLFLSGIEKKYPEELLEGRVAIEGNCIACLAKELTLLDDVKLKPTNFISRDGRFYFSLLKDMREKGFNVIDEVTILSNSSEAVLDAFEDKGGYEALYNMVDIVNLNNFDIYLDQLYRENLLCSLYSDGFNLLNEIEIKGKKVVPIKLLRRMTSSQVIDFYDTLISGYDAGQNSEIMEEEDICFENDWVDSLEEGSDMGVPYDVCGVDINGEDINGFRYLSNQTLGLHKGHLMMLAGFSSVGKSTIFVTLIMALLHRGEKIVIISNEERIQKMKIKLMMWMLARHNRYFQLTKSKLASGILTKEDKIEIKKAQKYWNENYKGMLKFVTINTNDISLIKKKIRDAHLKQGFTGFLLDTFKLSDDSFSGERQDLSLVKDSRELHNLAMKYDLIGMCSCQCGERFKGTLTLTANVLAGSKQTKEILQQLFMCRSLYNEEELNPRSKYYCQPFRMKKVNGKWISEEYTPDPEGVYVVLTVEKNRDGIDTPSNGVSYLLKFEGQYSVFKEVAQIKCKHGIIQG